jgi:glycosyltransferase involved in cell wall biosynthesis
MNDRPNKRTGLGVLVRMYPKLSETFVHQEIEGLKRAGINLTVYALRRPTDPVNQFAEIARDVTIHYIPERISLLRQLLLHGQALLTRPLGYLGAAHLALTRADDRGMRHLSTALLLAAATESDGIVHLHSHFASYPTGIAELAARLRPLSFSISAHAKDIYASSVQALRRKMSAARFTVTCTEYNRRHLLSIARATTRVHRIFHGVDCDHLQCATMPAAAAGQPPLILSVGRLREKKGFDLLIEACRLLRERGLSFQCDIIGYGDARPSLEAQIQSSGLAGTVNLLGPRPHEYVLKRYQQSTVFVLPCRIVADGDRDGIPNVLIEAMASGVAVVSTPVSGIPEAITDGVTGMLAKANDAVGLADTIARVLCDAPLRLRLAQNARTHVERYFSAARNIRYLHRLLLDAVDAEGRDPAAIDPAAPQSGDDQMPCDARTHRN